jgi:hypothetical protein
LVPELAAVLDQHGSRVAEQAGVDLADYSDLSLNLPGEGIRRIARQKWESDPLGILKDELLGIYTDERSYRIGADGEEVVGGVLSALPPGWHAIHSIPVGRSGTDIDHLVIGPGGIFTINTKHHPNANVWAHGSIVLVNRRPQDYVAKSRVERERATNLLSTACRCSVPVTAIIAVVGSQNGVRVKSQPADSSVVILDHTELLKWLLRQTPAMTADQVDRIFSRARLPITWRS